MMEPFPTALSNCFHDSWCKSRRYEAFANFQAFMFESSFSMALTKWGNETCECVDDEYYKCWAGLKSNFNPKRR